MFCGKCGATNPDDGKFCTRCGSALTVGPVAAVAAPTPVAGPTSVPVGFVEPPHTSGKAVTSLIFGFLFFALPAAVVAIVLGHIALSDIRKSAVQLKGHGIAVAGLVLGYLGIAMIPLLLIIAAVAIPNLLRSRMAANEASAVSSLRAIDVASLRYAGTYGNGYPPNLDTLTGEGTASCDHAGLISGPLASGQRDGYLFTYHLMTDGTPPGLAAQGKGAGCTVGGGSGFTVSADPVTPGATGNRSFYVDQTGIIRYEMNGAATANSAPLR